MSYTHILHPLAQEDYESALLWYLARSQRAAENFVIAVEEALSLICNNPTRWRNEHKHYYELGVRKYPFVIIYTIEKSKQVVAVSAIYHCKRNPQRKYRTP